jgi:hypothetical protein
MYRIEAWSQGDVALWAPGFNGGGGVGAMQDEARAAGAGRGLDAGDGEEASQQDGDGALFDFDESDLDGVASY